MPKTCANQFVLEVPNCFFGHKFVFMRATVIMVVVLVFSHFCFGQDVKVEFVPVDSIDQKTNQEVHKISITSLRRTELRTINDLYDYRVMFKWILPIIGPLPKPNKVVEKPSLNKKQKITYRIAK